MTRGPREFPLLSLPGFLTRPPLSRKITPLFPACTPPIPGTPPADAADSSLGLELGSARWEARLSKAKGTLPAFHHHPDSGRELGGSRGAIPGSFLSHKPPTPSSFLPCRQLGWGESRGWNRGRKPAQGQQETQEVVGRVGSRSLGYCSIFSGKKTGGKTEDGSPLPPGLRGIPLRLGQGVGVPRWLGPRREAERWDLPPTVDERSGWGRWQASPGPSGPGKDLDITGPWCSAPHKPLIHAQPRPGASKYPCSPLQEPPVPLQ